MGSENRNKSDSPRLHALAVLQLANDLRHELALLDRRIDAVRARIPDTALQSEFAELGSALDATFYIARELTAFGRRSGETERVDVSDLVHQTRGIIQRMLGDGIRLYVDLPAGTPHVQGDIVQIEWVLFSLVLNGRDAMNGRGALTIATAAVDPLSDELHAKARDTRWVRLTISDTGSGFRQEPDGLEEQIPSPAKAAVAGVSVPTISLVVRKLGGWLASEKITPFGTHVYVYLPADGGRLR